MKYCLICFFIWFVGCEKKAANVVNSVEKYNLVTPDNVWNLPEKLDEISGITPFESQEVACINDEKGTIYLYHLALNNVTNTISFTSKGDFEDIVMVGSEAFILESNGMLWKVNLHSASVQSTPYKTGLISDYDAEGLAYDSIGNRLLIAIKNKIRNNDNQEVNAIFAFDLGTNTVSATPLIIWDLETKGKNEMFAPSALAIHPETREIYIISSVGKKLAVVDWNGQVKSVSSLNYKHFKQPEGMFFDAKGNLYISNEGKKGKGNILKFNAK